MVGFNNSRIQTDKRQKMILVSIILSISVLLLASIFVSFYKPVIMNTNYNITNQNANDILTNSDNQVNKAANSSYAVMEGGRNIMLHYQNATTQLPMASTTKIMTAYIACISGKLNDTVTIPKVAVGVEGSSVYLKKGESPNKKEITNLMKESYVHNVKSDITLMRRSSTVISWTNWILSLVNTN